MKSLLLKTLIFATVFFAFSAMQYSQPEVHSGEKPGQMFAGETLKYEGKLNKIIHGISIADWTFVVSNVPNSDDLLIKSEAVSKGTLLRLFRYSFLQQYDSTVDLANFRITRTIKHDVQKERVRDSRAVFDYGEKW